ncbi:MAG TPA: tRNA pseudouridine(54/55) synthase Pus10, partial [Euryarchaeota archaeon]|nr:tRNA pseudouridine(54/55) synthase Pus10 [Euryarchaeota archaeon]
LIGKPALEMTKGKEVKLHGAGREDIDVRTLGSGRPFILEIKKPKLRKINLGELEKRINSESKGKVEVLGLRFSSKSEVKKIKEKRGRKRYRVVFKLDREIKEEDLEKLENLKGRILQRTPTRVLHRRADKFREREVYEIVIKEVKGNVGEAEIYCEGGLYVKELVSGDNGRTTPSFTEVLGSKAECLELDVLDIELEGE